MRCSTLKRSDATLNSIPAQALAVIAIALAIATNGCRNRPATDNTNNGAEPLKVFAVSYGLQYLTQQIVGDWTEVAMPDFGTVQPRKWQPDLPMIRRLQNADLIVTNGGGARVADWMMAVSVSPSKICQTIQGIKLDDFIAVDDAPVHSHGPEGEHSHSGVVATLWLDPSLAIDQSQFILDRLCRQYPDQADGFRDNHRQLVEQLQLLANEFTSVSGLQNQNVLTSEPSFKYFLRAIQVSDTHFFWSQEASPITADMWQEFDEKRDAESRVMLWPQDPPRDVATQLLERNIQPIRIDLLINQPPGGDYLEVMRNNLRQLKTYLAQADRP